ncbi:MAG: hypothetical protein LBM18_02455 [Oscillospiraceae bacterium]|jgi:hypothetical protein|nr:hypothetical protein [Oscillospiraceae bacterium]
MATGNYAFALFIFALVCAVLILARFLFSGIRQQKKLLSEKEAELLKLYRMVEDAMEEYFDQVRESKDEIRRLGQLHLPQAEPLELEAPPIEKKPRSRSKKAASQDVIPLFEHVVDELVSGDPLLEAPPAPESRRARITRLLDEGADKTQIAKQLGITVTEVEIVTGLHRVVSA